MARVSRLWVHCDLFEQAQAVGQDGILGFLWYALLVHVLMAAAFRFPFGFGLSLALAVDAFFRFAMFFPKDATSNRASLLL